MAEAPAGDKTLTPNDAVKVLEELLPAQNQCYVLGLKLGLAVHVVDGVHKNYQTQHDRLLHIIIAFLNGVEPRPTWRVIVDALRSPGVNLPALAKRVEEAHFPGPTSTRDVVPRSTQIGPPEASIQVIESQPAQYCATTTPTDDNLNVPPSVAPAQTAQVNQQPSADAYNSLPQQQNQLQIPVPAPPSKTTAHTLPAKQELLQQPSGDVASSHSLQTSLVLADTSSLSRQQSQSQIPVPGELRAQLVKDHSPTARQPLAAHPSGTAAQTSPAKQDLSQQPSDPLQSQPASLVPVHIKDIETEIKQLEERFNKLKNTCRSCLEKCKISVNTIVDALTDMPADEIPEHRQFLDRHVYDLYKASNHSELFGKLSLYCNYLSYQLVDYLIRKFKLKIKGDMETYKKDLQQFRKKTPLTLFYKTQTKRYIKPSADFREVVAEFDWPEDVTLEVVEQFRQKYACHYQLRECAMMLPEVRPGSFIVTWFIPESIVEKLKAKVPRSLLKEYFVTKLTIAGTCIYRFHKTETKALALIPSTSSSSSAAVKSESAGKKAPVEEDYLFVEQPSDDFFCPVTFGLLLQPHLTSCCGNHLSHEASTRIQGEGKPCPLCKQSRLSTVLNKHFQRQVNEFRVFCRHEDRGCVWQGEFSDLKRHVQSCPMRDQPLMSELQKDPLYGDQETSATEHSNTRIQMFPDPQSVSDPATAESTKGTAEPQETSTLPAKVQQKQPSSYMPEPTEKYLQAALQDGYIPHKDDIFLIQGPGGVGKSSLISMFLGTQRDLTRDSTRVAEEPLHLCPIRDMSTCLLTADWEVVDNDRLSRMFAHTSHQLLVGTKDEEKGSEGEEEEGERKQEEERKQEGKRNQVEGRNQEGETKGQQEQSAAIAAKAYLATPMPSNKAYLATPKPSKKGILTQLVSRLQASLSKVFKKSPQPGNVSTLGDDPDNIAGLFDKFQEGLHNIMRESREAHDLLLYYSIRLTDSGGQPLFYEIFPILLPEITGILSLYKLSEEFAAHEEVAFYKEGELPCQSYLTREQVIRHDLLAIQSQATRNDIEETPNLAFVGTFQDLQHICPETPDQKDEQLHSMITEILPEEMQHCVITNGGSLRQASFRLNTRTPGKRDYETARRLKVDLMKRSRAKPRDVPLKWSGLEVTLRMLMKELGRQVMSLEECQFIGYKLGFDLPSLRAALNYLRQLHIICFYDALPNVVFASSQVILDKITELVTHSLELKKGQRAIGGLERKFLQQGIISLEILKSPSLSKHYKSELFEPEDLLKVLVSLLIVTDVGTGEYLAPCVLEMSNIYPSPPLPLGFLRSSFIFLFSKKTPMFGIYCCTNASFMRDAGWKLLTEGGEEMQVARNSFTYEMPRGFPGKLTFLDPLSSYLEVVLEFPAVIAAELCAKLYREIRDTFITSIKKAMKTLNYEVRTPEVSFLCPEQSSACSPLPHPAAVDNSHSFLRCTLNPGSVSHSLTQEQKMWLQTPTAVFKGKDSSTHKKQAAATPPLTSRGQDLHTPKKQAAATPLTSSESKNSRTYKKQATAAPPLTISGDGPTLPELLQLNILQWVADKYKSFGTVLLNDVTGTKMAIIRDKCRGDHPERITMEILRDWLQGKGIDVSWESLIETLRKCGLSYRADQIQMALDQHKFS